MELAEKAFEILINDSLRISTEVLPSVIVGEVFYEQLISSGGTGTVAWFDRDNDLTETGLSMNATGLIAGLPQTAGIIQFTALVSDAVGCNDEKLLSIEVLAPYVCGDANNDGDLNVADGVYVIGYVFNGGPPPDPLCVGDTNGDGDVNVADAVYMIAYVFSGGPPPLEGCCP
jgi:hypothetical protein